MAHFGRWSELWVKRKNRERQRRWEQGEQEVQSGGAPHREQAKEEVRTSQASHSSPPHSDMSEYLSAGFSFGILIPGATILVPPWTCCAGTPSVSLWYRILFPISRPWPVFVYTTFREQTLSTVWESFQELNFLSFTGDRESENRVQGENSLSLGV